MKTEIEIKIKPLQVPCYVNEAIAPAAPAVPAPGPYEPSPENYQPASRTFALRELSVSTLEALIEEFTVEVYRIAGKEQPPVAESPSWSSLGVEAMSDAVDAFPLGKVPLKEAPQKSPDAHRHYEVKIGSGD